MSDFIDELPEGWIETSVGQLTEPSKEKVDPTSLEKESNYIGLEHIKSNAGSISGYGISSEVCSSKSVFKKGDLLYGKLRPYLNKVYLAEIDGICSTDIMVFPKSETILNQYAKYRFYLMILFDMPMQIRLVFSIQELSLSLLPNFLFFSHLSMNSGGLLARSNN
jgi:hypothetical protein